MIGSVVPKYRVIKCPDCKNLINSNAPVCSDCGLTMSELEVFDRAEIDEGYRFALSAADYLYGYAWVSVVYVILGFAIGAFIEPAMGFGQMFVSIIALTLFWWRYIAWGRRYGQISSSDEVFAEAVETRRQTLMIGFALSGLVFAVTYWTVT